jgi:hypothetical protein
MEKRAAHITAARESGCSVLGTSHEGTTVCCPAALPAASNPNTGGGKGCEQALLEYAPTEKGLPSNCLSTELATIGCYQGTGGEHATYGCVRDYDTDVTYQIPSVSAESSPFASGEWGNVHRILDEHCPALSVRDRSVLRRVPDSTLR